MPACSPSAHTAPPSAADSAKKAAHSRQNSRRGAQAQAQIARAVSSRPWGEIRPGAPVISPSSAASAPRRAPRA